MKPGTEQSRPQAFELCSFSSHFVCALFAHKHGQPIKVSEPVRFSVKILESIDMFPKMSKIVDGRFCHHFMH